ncbi:Ubiquitin carboxyl-terminal hydrolase isozyme L3 [Balamuthia mandrillaris]
MAAEGKKGPRWIPLESNPDVMNSFIHKAGVSKEWGFGDCYGTDPELLAMVPQPCLAVLLLYPSLVNEKELKRQQKEKIEKEGQVVSPKVYYMKQLVGNACGTIAVIHAIYNNLQHIQLEEGFIKGFYEKTKDMEPLPRGEALGEDTALEEVHAEVAESGQTEAPTAQTSVDYHFICFTAVDGHLYELDGGKAFPINHGPTTSESFLSDAVNYIKNYYFANANEEQSSHFSILTLGPLD